MNVPDDTRRALEAARAHGSRSVSIVVPTYREATNLPALVERVHAALSGSGIEWELIVADGDSHDGSEAVVAELARGLPIRIETRRESPRDLSRSLRFGLGRARFDRIVVMDADLSHPPSASPICSRPSNPDTTWRSEAATCRGGASIPAGAPGAS